jgi:hypothetical protein
MRRWLYVGGAALAACALSFLAGRFSAPARVETRVEWRKKIVTQTEWKDRVVTQRGPVRVVERIVEKPGAEREVTRWIERGPVTTTKDLTGNASATTEINSATRTVSETGRPGWSGGLSAAWDPGRPSSMPDRIGLELDRRIVGTVWLGARASAEPDLGALRLGLALRVEF